VCDKDGGKLVHRADDNETTIRQRLVAYENQTQPLIDYYRGKGLLHDVEGNRGADAIAQELVSYLQTA
jgi:adenylate kinase